jgi:hypothetical protein
LIGLFRSRAALEAETLVLRHHLNVLQRKSPKRVALNSIDRLVLVFYRLAPGVMDALKIVLPETLLALAPRWVTSLLALESRPCGGRPKTEADTRTPNGLPVN